MVLAKKNIVSRANSHLKLELYNRIRTNA